jgi:hypothetical protein
MKRNVLEFGVPIGLLTLLVLCTFSIPTWTYRGNFEPTAPSREFDSQDLLLSQDAIPQWEASTPFLPAGNDLCTTECIARHFGTKEGYPGALATQYVFRYSTTGIAQRTFDYEYQAKSRVYRPVKDWDFQSSIAQQSLFGCNTLAGNAAQSCLWAARYDEYIISFITTIIPGEMDLDSLRQILGAIDKQVAHHLEKPMP